MFEKKNIYKRAHISNRRKKKSVVLDDLLIILGKRERKRGQGNGEGFKRRQEIKKKAFWRKDDKFNLDINRGEKGVE